MSLHLGWVVGGSDTLSCLVIQVWNYFADCIGPRSHLGHSSLDPTLTKILGPHLMGRSCIGSHLISRSYPYQGADLFIYEHLSTGMKR